MAEVKGGQKEKIGVKKWRIRVSLGKDPETGKYLRSPSRIAYGTSKDADAAIAEYREELQAKLDNRGATSPSPNTPAISTRTARCWARAPCRENPSAWRSPS